MSIIAELFSPKVSAGLPGPLDDYWYMPLGYRTDSGELISPETAMRISTVWACVKIISETLASLPLVVYRKRKDGGKDKATDHWLYNLLHNEPNYAQTSLEWREMMQGHLCLRGNAYSFINWNGRKADSLIPFHPDMVEPKRMTDGSIQYEVTSGAGTKKYYLASQILHIPALSFDGLKGLNPIEYVAQSLGLSIAAEKFGAKFFKNGTKASGVVMYPNQLGDKGQENLRKSIAKHIGGDNIFSPLVLEEGAKWEQLSINPEDAQFLETRKYQAIDICRIFRVPPHMVAELDKATFSNIEHQSLEFVIHTIRPWLVRWEQRFNKQLFNNDEEYFAEFKVDGLLRGDTKSRYEAYGKGIQDGWLNRNEARDMENLNPVDGLDEYLQPLNMTSAGQQPQQDEPAPEPEPEPEPAPTKKPKKKAINAVMHDTAARIANAEIKAISSRIDKAAENRGRFCEWINELGVKQEDYVKRCIALVSSVADGQEFSDSVKGQITASLSEHFKNGTDAATVFEEFKTKREQQIKNILREAIK
jgi:HK97 family phage portal protein